MRKVLMYPLPSHAKQDATQSINNIVLALQKHLPAYGYELTENPHEADLVAGHAGTPDGKTRVDVAHLSGLYPTAYGGDGWWWSINSRVIETCRHAKAVTVPSAWVGEILQRDMGFSPDVIGWGIDAEEWQPPAQHGNYVLWNKARADSVCDPEPVVKLAAIYPQQLFLTTFLSKDADNLTAQAYATPNIRAVGRVPYEEMKQHVRNAAVYLATTKETFGIGTIEALACGVPVVGYNYGGTANIVQHGVTGYLVEPGDIEGLKNGVAYCLKHRATLSQNARKTALLYTWERCAQAFAGVYNRVLAPQVGVKVSVVIPCYNYGRFVEEAIESATKQNVNFEYEIIVVDDGSTDDSYQVARKARIDWMVREYPVYVYKKENGGVASARNYGIEHAQGRYIVCLDADDKFGSPHFLQTLADALDADTGLGIAYTGLHVMNEAGELSPNGVNGFPGVWNFDLQLERKNQVPTCCMFRKEAWRRAGGYRKEMTPAEDANLWVRIGALGYRALQVTTEGWFHYRLHGNSLSTSVRTGKKVEPNWLNFPYIADGRHPFASQAKPANWSHPVRNYDKPIISVIIPVGKGHEHILYRALDSIEYQTLREWEVVVVNDTGSPLPLIGYEWIREVKAECRSAAGSRNLGVKVSRAGLITFLDADDYFLPTFLERMVSAYRRSQGRYVYCDWISVNKEGEFEPHITPEFEPELMFKSKSVHSINVVMKRSDALAHPFDETMGTWEDVDFFMQLVASGVCGRRVNEPLIVYDYNTGTLREKGETVKKDLIDFLYNRYKGFIEGTQMCACGGVKGSEGALQDNVAAINAQAGDMVLIEYRGGRAGHTVVGGVTNQQYGYRQYGDVFNVWREDALNDPERFAPMMRVEDEVMETPEPEEPVLA